MTIQSVVWCLADLLKNVKTIFVDNSACMKCTSGQGNCHCLSTVMRQLSACPKGKIVVDCKWNITSSEARVSGVSEVQRTEVMSVNGERIKAPTEWLRIRRSCPSPTDYGVWEDVDRATNALWHILKAPERLGCNGTVGQDNLPLSIYLTSQ